MNQLRLPPLPTVRDLVRLFKLRALKQLSQNFLLDERITDKIVKSAGNIKNHYVCEVGPGPGSITRSILRQHPKKLIVVEKDSRFLPVLSLLQEASKDFTEMQIELNDIRKFNLEIAFDGAQKNDWLLHPPPIHLIGNLPFNVSTILLVEWLNFISRKQSAWTFGRTSMLLTFQKEVAERMVAKITEKQRCRLSVICQLYCDVNYKFTIPGRAFLPKPKVDVGVVKLTPKRYPLVDLPFRLVEKVLRTVFNMRQKFCHRGAERLFPENLRDTLGPRLFQLADVNFTSRPFEVSNEEYVRLCYAYKMLCEEYPEIHDYDFRQPKKVMSSAAVI